MIMAIDRLGKTLQITRISKTASSGECVMLGGERVAGSARVLGKSRIQELNKQAHLHHQQALILYDITIHTMRNDIGNSKKHLYTTLIISMIILCFETIHGNHKCAAV